MSEPDWWRGRPSTVEPRGYVAPGSLVTADLGDIPEQSVDQRTGLRSMYFFKASASDVEFWLNDVQLAVECSEFNNCHFRQRVKPVTNELGFSAKVRWAIAQPSAWRALGVWRINPRSRSTVIQEDRIKLELQRLVR